MKILLIQPKMNKRPMDTDLKTRMSPPLSLLTLMNLTPEQHHIVLVNENVEPIDYSYDADLVGITITLDVMPRAIEIAERFRRSGTLHGVSSYLEECRQLKSPPLVVAGGIHVTCSPEQCLPHFDAICVGAAEGVWVQIIEDAAQKRLRQIYRDEEFCGEKIMPPRYQGLNKRRYLYTNIITTSRGCPNKCGFCYNSSENRSYVRRPVKDVLMEIESGKARHVFFIDDNFIGCPDYTRELVEGFKGMDLKWSAAVTTKIGDYPDLLDLMASTGCQSLFIGFESINDSSLKGVNKDNSFEKYERLVGDIHSRGIMINASMVFGLDGDGPDVFEKTLDWLVKNKIETLTAHILTPYPGTELYKRMEREGRITDRDLSKYNTSHVVFQPKGMSPSELYNGYIRMYRQFYSFKNIFQRIPTHKSQRVPFMLFNIFYRKYGGFTSALSRLIPLHILGRLAEVISYRIKFREVFIYLFAAVTAFFVYMGLDQNIEYSLRPHALAINALYQLRFEFIPDLGYREANGLFTISRECLGGRLFVCLFSILAIYRLNSHKSLIHGIRSVLSILIGAILLSYVITTARIAASLPFSGMPDFKLIHTVLSLIIYFCSALTLYGILTHVRAKPQRSDVC